MARATSLFKAYLDDVIPHEGACIISSGFDAASLYSLYEITSYRELKRLERSPGGLLFDAEGFRSYIIVEPADFAERELEPFSRGEGKSIPCRFEDLIISEGRCGERILVSRLPLLLESPFAVHEVSGDDFAFIFYHNGDIGTVLRRFIADVLYNDSGLDKDDAIKAARLALDSAGCRI